jgi:hypothetical protein
MFEKGCSVFWVYLSYSFASCWPLSRVDCAEAAASCVCVWVDDQSTTGGGVDRMKDTHTQVYIISLCRPFSNSSRQSSFVSFNGPATPSTSSSIPLFFFTWNSRPDKSIFIDSIIDMKETFFFRLYMSGVTIAQFLKWVGHAQICS